MKRLFLPLVIAALAAGCDTAGDEAGEIACAIVAPGTAAVVHHVQGVDVGFSGAVERIELLAGGVVVAGADVPLDRGLDTLTIDWDTTAAADGAVELTARARAADGREVVSEPLGVEVDNTAPEVGFGLERLALVRGAASVPLAIVEPHLAAVRIADQFGEVYAGALDAEGGFPWDTTSAEDRIHWMTLEATDVGGYTTRLERFPLIVANRGELYVPTYTPSAQVYVPADYATVEYHTRGHVPTHAGVYRVITWMTWDPTGDWLMEYSLGEGLCPHRGIAFVSAESRTGEVIIELARDELPFSIVTLFPPADRTSSTFPTNDDPLTFGSFFGHVSPLEPADHVGDRVPIEMHFVLIDEA